MKHLKHLLTSISTNVLVKIFSITLYKITRNRSKYLLDSIITIILNC